MLNTLTFSTEMINTILAIDPSLVEMIADYFHFRPESVSLGVAYEETAHSNATGRPVWMHELFHGHRIMVYYFFGTHEEILARLSAAEIMST